MSQMEISAVIPVSFVIPTRNRADRLVRTLQSLGAQSSIPAEVVLVDASSTPFPILAGLKPSGTGSLRIVSVRAETVGAAAQRNQGVQWAQQPFIAFCDDDIDFEPECIKRLWNALQSDVRLGGVNAMIVNQQYQPPGRVSRFVFTLLHGRNEPSFAGRAIGPAVNLLPEDRDDLPQVVPVEWLNLGATIYRREALPTPPFDSVFTGYSLLEDLTLSLRVGRNWKLANVRTARIFHDSQPGSHKADVITVAAMELVNRHYVMTKVLQRTGVLNHLRLLLWETFQLLVCAVRSSGRRTFLARCRGKWRGIREIRRRSRGAAEHHRLSGASPLGS